MSLADKIHRREQEVEAAGFFFLVRRPTDVEMMELRGQKMGASGNPLCDWLARRYRDFHSRQRLAASLNSTPKPVPMATGSHQHILGLLVEAIFRSLSSACRKKMEQSVKRQLAGAAGLPGGLQPQPHHRKSVKSSRWNLMGGIDTARPKPSLKSSASKTSKYGVTQLSAIRNTTGPNNGNRKTLNRH